MGPSQNWIHTWKVKSFCSEWENIVVVLGFECKSGEWQVDEIEGLYGVPGTNENGEGLLESYVLREN